MIGPRRRIEVKNGGERVKGRGKEHNWSKERLIISNKTTKRLAKWKRERMEVEEPV